METLSNGTIELLQENSVMELTSIKVSISFQ